MNISFKKPRSESTREPGLNPQLQLLRARLEAELQRPAVVLVTSALPGDGKSMTAHALARSFSRSGHRTALVDRAGGGAARGGPTSLQLPADGGVEWRDGLSDFISGTRERYEYTLLDAGTFLKSEAAMALARMVDGILLVVRIGRAPSDEDEVMIRTIEHCGGRVVGVVATDDAAIAEFARMTVTSDDQAREPAQRGVTPIGTSAYTLSTEPLAR
jgi:Mrp family chromosome partitioning ATPase